jgi:transposase InsO family protein
MRLRATSTAIATGSMAASRAMGIRDRPTAPASPWQNGFAERLIGSIRRECVDHIIVLREMHLRRVLRAILPFLAFSSTIVLGVVQPPPPPPMPPGRVFVAREQ